jgi:acetyltransferase
MTYVAPDAAALEDRWLAPDGTPVTIRGIRAGDAALEARFVRELSARSRRLRFMDGMRELTPRQVERFTQPDSRRELALVALAPPKGTVGDRTDGAGDGHGESIVAVARYVVDADAQGCEFAIVIADAWQHHGLGRYLLARLIGLARGAGLTTMRGTVMAENAAMLGLARRLGFGVTPLPGEYGMREVTLPL